DDDVIMLKAMNNILNKAGHEVSLAYNGKEALEKIEVSDFDLIITDIMMPYYNGLVVLNNIKSNPAKRHTKVIAMSSAGNIDIKSEAFSLGAEDFMMKPIIPNQLIEVVKKHTSGNVTVKSFITRKPTASKV
ncbi:MAG: response regulator, partial [Chitinophagia bacterium]|nr:response regulator [Chitinophagia bacterium]